MQNYKRTSMVAGIGAASILGILGLKYLARFTINKINDKIIKLITSDIYDENLYETISSTMRVGPQVVLETNLRADEGKLIERPMGPVNKYPKLDDIKFNVAQLYTMPTEILTDVDFTITIGKFAKHPLQISNPMIIALWLDRDKTSPYDFYQYWRNIDDADVENCLALLTFLPMDEVRRLGSLKDENINEAKKVLAYEVTKIVHGEKDAEESKKAAEALFGKGSDDTNVPGTELSKDEFQKNCKILDLLFVLKLIPSKGEGRRLIQQGGVYINDNRVESIDYQVSINDLKDGILMIRKGKKIYYRLTVK